MQATQQKFTTTAGPIQTKRVDKALRDLEWRGKTRVELRGTIGVDERRAELIQMCGEPCEAATAARHAIGEQFGWTITAANHAEIVAALELATRELELPVDDCRESATQTEQREARAAAEQDQRDALRREVEDSRAAIFAKKPAGAVAVILAVLDEDDSDMMSDYHNHKTTRVVAIGWRTGKREDFRQLRKAAAGFPMTTDLGPDAPDSVEHRENWSMGSGNYVKRGDDDSSGWRIISREEGALPYAVIEDQIPTAPNAAGAQTTRTPCGAFTIEKHYHTKRGFDMWIVVLAAHVETDEFVRLRTSCQAAGGWYSRQWGGTPGGFAFKSEDAAKAWADGSVSTTPVDTPPVRVSVTTATATANTGKAARLRQLAEGMTAEIENKRRPMTQNPTPKRMKEYYSRMHDAGNAERCQRALFALADAHEAGTLPSILCGLKSKAEILPMVSHGTECRGYYDVVSTNQYRDKSTTAVALQQFMEQAKTPEQQAAEVDRQAGEKLREMEAELRFTNIPGFFPTPRPIIDRMIELASIEATHCVLEPSAGKGDIADAIREVAPCLCCEVVPRLREILKAKGHALTEATDFLTDFDPRGDIDRIVMNPPFEKGQDMEHIQHAFRCLAPGGRLVSVCSTGPFFRSDRKSTEFREFIDSTGAEVIDLPADAFKGPDAFRQTGTATKLVVIEKPI